MEYIVKDNEVHTLIVWSKAIDQKEEIESKIREKFEFLATFEIAWRRERFLENLFPFYAHSQKHLPFNEYRNLLLTKIEHCGDEPFHLYVFRDTKPAYDFRNTSSGTRSVNTNIFDLKAELRVLTDGGHKIHASDNTFESNKDLTILLGQNTKDFLQNLEDWRKVKKITANCLGVGGFKNISELFYLLNSSIDYVVLRNFECLPEDYTIEGHGDIDLLVEDLNYTIYLTGAKSVFPSEEFRVHNTININGALVPFDFRYLGDEYYDRKWQEHILSNNQYNNDIVRIPNPIDHFYSLLYHAYVQKVEVSTDYLVRLQHLAIKAKVQYTGQTSKVQVREILDDFLDSKQYRYCVPIDRSVFYNTDFLSMRKKPGEYGQLLSTQVARVGRKGIVTEVFYNIEKNRVYKVCPDAIASNEVRGLKLLRDSGIAPKLYNVIKKEGVTVIEMEYLQGVPMSQLFRDGSFWTFRNVKKMISDTVEILEILIDKDILHRDIKPDNFLIQKIGRTYEVRIIDFGWSQSYSTPKDQAPFRLGGLWAYGGNQFSDVFSLGRTLQQIFNRFPSIHKWLEETLLTYTPAKNSILPMEFKNVSHSLQHIKLTPREKFVLKAKRYPQVIKVAKRVYIKMNRILNRT